MSKMYVPVAWPAVFHVAVELAPYAWRIVQAPPGGWTQNWKTAWGQPVAVPLKVTCVPGACGEAGLGAFQVTPVQGIGGGGGVPLVVTAKFWVTHCGKPKNDWPSSWVVPQTTPA